MFHASDVSHLFLPAYNAMSQPSPYLSSLPAVTTTSSYACPMDRWPLLTSPYDVTANMTNGLHSRLAPYVSSMQYTAYAGTLPPSCIPACPGQSLADSMLANMAAVRPMPAHAHAHAHSSLHNSGLPDMGSLNMDLDAECKRINSLHSLRLKAKDHTSSVPF